MTSTDPHVRNIGHSRNSQSPVGDWLITDAEFHYALAKREVKLYPIVTRVCVRPARIEQNMLES